MNPSDRGLGRGWPGGPPSLGRWNTAGMSPEMQATVRARLEALGIDPMAAVPPAESMSGARLPLRPPARDAQRESSLSGPNFAHQAAQDPLLRSYQPSLNSPRQTYLPAGDATGQPYQPPSNPPRRGGNARMNGDEFLDRGRQDRGQDNNFEGNRWGRQEESELAPLDRPNRDRPAVTIADRRAQHAAAARASAAAAAAAAAAPAAGTDNDTVAFWPDLRRQLRTEADLRNLLVDCAICAESTRDMMVLTCGHMLCRGCLDRVHTNMEGEDDPFYVHQPPSCPFCKLPLGRKSRCLTTCRDTRDQRFGIPVPTLLRDLGEFPLTLPEGGSNARACSECREARIKQAMDALFAALLNCDEQDKKLIRVPYNMTQAIVEARMDANFERVPELQYLMDSINELAVNPNFTRRYAGVFPQPQPIDGFVAVRKRGQNRDR